MSHFKTRSFLAALVASVALVGLSSDLAEAKGKKSGRSRTPGNYLVPPPPAYMPSILPELTIATNVAPEKKPVYPYNKYIYTTNGHEEKAPVKPNKYVTYWNKPATN